MNKEKTEDINEVFLRGKNTNSNYLFRKSKLSGQTIFDIENENLVYSDCEPVGMHGLQCNYSGSHENFNKILDLCQKVTDLMRQIDKLNDGED
jgi:hypothetical protein